jgi:uncharacterized protein
VNHQDQPASPCVRNCTLDPKTDICLGCHRTLEEILAWSSYTAEQKLVLLETLKRRRADGREAREGS